jgi:hypothetical protein
MRTVTYNAGAYLVEELLRAGVVARFLHDGGDILLFETWNSEKISVHLIESSIELYEIKSILAGNEEQGIYTLFILWCDRMLPGDGQWTFVSDWMSAFYTLYGDRIYAYDIYGTEIFVFPVNFEGYGYHRFAHYGTTVNLRHLVCEDITTNLYTFKGTWRVATFHHHYHQQAANHPRNSKQPDIEVPKLHPLQKYFDVLDVESDDDRETIKRAYRLLARRYHPDLNSASEANEKMQQINEAYGRLEAVWEAEDNATSNAVEKKTNDAAASNTAKNETRKP